MLLQTNSYVVPKDRRAEHARLLRRFRQTLARLGCDQFEVYEQAGQNWGTGDTSGRFVQIMKFRDRRHQLAVQAAERSDPQAQQLIAEFCELINFPYQQENGLFAVGFYNSVLPIGPARPGAIQHPEEEAIADHDDIAAAQAAAATAAEVAPPDQQTYVAATQAAAEFSGEPVPASQAPVAEPAVESVTEHQDEAAAPLEGAEPAIEAEAAPPEHVPPEVATPEQPDAFREEMEALGAALDDEPMTPTAELPDSEAELHPLDVELSHHLEELPHAGSPEPAGHTGSGNGALVSDNGSESHHELNEVDTVLADELGRPAAGEGHGAFDSLLDDPFESDSARNAPEHPSDHPAAELPSSGSGIGAVLDGLDDADLDVALPAELIDDDLEPHAPDAHRQGGPSNERG